MTIEFTLLGPLSIVAGGVSHAVRADRVRATLAVLVLNAGRAVSHDELADELWPATTLANARNAIQANATRIRRALQAAGGPDLLRTVRNGYLLDLPPEAVDSNRFLDLAGQGAALLRTDPNRAVDRLHEALALWRGPALLDAGDGMRCRAAAASLAERRWLAWEDLISARLAVGDVRRAVPELSQLVASHPLHEGFTEQLMVALYRSGRQGEALDLFHQIRRRLDAELGLSPGAALRSRYSAILTQDPALSLAA